MQVNNHQKELQVAVPPVYYHSQEVIVEKRTLTQGHDKITYEEYLDIYLIYLWAREMNFTSGCVSSSKKKFESLTGIKDATIQNRLRQIKKENGDKDSTVSVNKKVETICKEYAGLTLEEFERKYSICSKLLNYGRI